VRRTLLVGLFGLLDHDWQVDRTGRRRGVDAGRRRDRPVEFGALVVYGLARVAIVRYPTDPPEREPTPTGRTHAILASIAFVALGLAAWRLGLGLADDPAWPTFGPLLAALSVVAPVATFATFAAGGTPGARPWFGAVERVFYAAGFGWLLVVALGAVLFGLG